MSRRFSVPGLLLMCLAACGRKADLVITGGVVWTGLSSGQPQPGAVAVRGGRILAVGDTAAVRRYVGGETQVLSARGGLIMPGFSDGHTHFINGGFQLASVTCAMPPRRRSSSGGSKHTPRSSSRVNGSRAATGITPSGRAPRCRGANGSIR